MQYIFKNKFNHEFSEREIMEDLLQYGETENIIARRGFSLLDMKKVFLYHGYSAAGYWMTPENGVNYSEEELDYLQSEVPFISPISLEGALGFIVIIKINNQNLTFIHPRLGYIQIPISELINGKLRNNEDWIIFLADHTQE
jgi:predicted double-glycine peptidase